MKLNKIYTFVLTALVFAGCSEEDEIFWNSQEATVGMGEVEFVCKENKGIVSVPVVVEGERNGSIEVTVEVTESGEYPAMANVHYFLTSDRIIIPADATEGKVEFRVVDDNEINESRTFTITLKNVKGKATIDAAAMTTNVALKDNDSQVYERLQGRWKMTSVSEQLGNLSWKVNIIGADEGAEGYNEVLQVTGLPDFEWTSMTLRFSYDDATKKGYVYIPFGVLLAQGVDLLGIGGTQDVVTATFDSKNNFITTGGIYGYWNEDYTEITFDKGQPLYAWVYYNGNPTADSFLFDCSNIKLTK